MATLEQIYIDPERGLNKATFIKSARVAGFTSGEANKHYARELAARVHQRTTRNQHSIVAGPGQWAADLTFYPDYSGLPANRKKEGILVCIEQTSRFAFCRPFHSKSPEELAPLFAELLREHKGAVHSIATDAGNEFKGAVRELFDKHSVKHFASDRKGATSRVERFNRTLREKISRWFTASGTHAWVDVLPKLVAAHNNTPSRVLLGWTPQEVLDDIAKALSVRTHDAERSSPADAARHAIAEGAQVRTALEHTRFAKKSGPRWSSDVGTVEYDTAGSDKLLLRVRGPDGKLLRRRYAIWELLPEANSVVSRSEPAAAARVDVPAVRRKKAAAHLLRRESMDADAIVTGPRSSRGVLPQRFRE